MAANTLHVLSHNDYLIRVYQFVENISYYAGIMLNAFSDRLCSELCWHNWLVPTCVIVIYMEEISVVPHFMLE